MDDFGVKNIGKEHIEHLLKTLKKNHKFPEDWEGNLHNRITLDWNYEEGYLDIPMPGYIEKLIQRVRHEKPTKPQHSPYKAPLRIYGTWTKNTVLPNTKLDKKRCIRV